MTQLFIFPPTLIGPLSTPVNHFNRDHHSVGVKDASIGILWDNSVCKHTIEISKRFNSNVFLIAYFLFLFT